MQKTRQTEARLVSSYTQQRGESPFRMQNRISVAESENISRAKAELERTYGNLKQAAFNPDI